MCWPAMLRDMVLPNCERLKLGDGGRYELWQNLLSLPAVFAAVWRKEHGFSVFLSLHSCMLSYLPETTWLALLSHKHELDVYSDSLLSLNRAMLGLVLSPPKSVPCSLLVTSVGAGGRLWSDNSLVWKWGMAVRATGWYEPSNPWAKVSSNLALRKF